MKFTLLPILLLTAADICAQTPRREANAYRSEGRKWGYEEGFERNHEAQYYQRDNACCRGGILTIEARRERRPSAEYDPNGKNWDQKLPFAEYTSSSINTRGKYAFRYGRLEVRARIPAAKGAWPAIWLLGTSLPWPHNGEIDVMEYYHTDGIPYILANAGMEYRENTVRTLSRARSRLGGQVPHMAYGLG